MWSPLAGVSMYLLLAKAPSPDHQGSNWLTSTEASEAPPVDACGAGGLHRYLPLSSLPDLVRCGPSLTPGTGWYPCCCTLIMLPIQSPTSPLIRGYVYARRSCRRSGFLRQRGEVLGEDWRGEAQPVGRGTRADSAPVARIPLPAARRGRR